MRQKTVTRADLANSLHEEIGMSSKDCSYFVEEVLGNMATALANGDEVKIPNFGTFAIRQKNERTGRNPKTNEDHVIPARKVLIFKASKKLKERVTARSK